MTLISIIQADILAARKARDTVALKYLTTLFAAAERIGKDARRDTTDAEVLKTVGKFQESVALSLQHAKAGSDMATELTLEATYLQAFSDAHSPKKADMAEVQAAVTEAVASLEVKNMKAMGQVMAVLSSKFGDGLDKTKASAMVRAALS